MSNFYCHPGKAGGLPIGLDISAAMNMVAVAVRLSLGAGVHDREYPDLDGVEVAAFDRWSSSAINFVGGGRMPSRKR